MSKATKIVERTAMLMRAKSPRARDTAAIETPTWYRSVVENPPSQYTLLNARNYDQFDQDRKPARASEGFFYKTRSKAKFAGNGHHLTKLRDVSFPEDKVRTLFYEEHPFELARPRNMVENETKLQLKRDWSSIKQPGLKLSGEHVVQRTMWLSKHNSIAWREAYEQAKLEFYRLRLQEQAIEEVSAEEAVMNGAVFAPSALERGFAEEQRVVDEYFELLPAELARREAAL